MHHHHHHHHAVVTSDAAPVHAPALHVAGMYASRKAIKHVLEHAPHSHYAAHYGGW